MVYDAVSNRHQSIASKDIKKIYKTFLFGSVFEVLSEVAISMLCFQLTQYLKFPASYYVVGGVSLALIYPIIRQNKVIVICTEKENFILYTGFKTRKIFKTLKKNLQANLFE